MIREKRLDMEDALVNMQRTVDEMKKNHAKLITKEKAIEKEQKAVESEISEFQKEKQTKLNLINYYVGLRMSQVKNRIVFFLASMHDCT